MVLKCLNHIYRLSTDLMFFTWSPLVWMKINWWKMRKDSAKRVEETFWIVAPPSGHFWHITESWSQWRKSHTSTHHRSSQGGWYFLYVDKRDKMISSKLSGIAPDKEVTVTYHEKGSLGFPLYFFHTGTSDQVSSRHFHISPSSSSLSSLT